MKAMRTKAFTLVEVLVAVSLFSVAMLGVVQLLPLTQRYLQQSSQATQAVLLAQEQIETVKATSYTSLVVGTTPAFEPTAAVSTSNGDPFAKFTRGTVISYVDPAANYAIVGTDTGMKQAVVTVGWTEGRRAVQYSLSTYVYTH